MEDTKNYDEFIKQQLSKFIKFEGINESQFCKLCGLSNGWWNAKGVPSGESIKRIKATYPNLSLNWVFTGEGGMYGTEKEKEISRVPIQQYIESLETPVSEECVNSLREQLKYCIENIEFLKKQIEDRDKMIERYDKMIDSYMFLAPVLHHIKEDIKKEDTND